jgi:hypothetical protein
LIFRNSDARTGWQSGRDENSFKSLHGDNRANADF